MINALSPLWIVRVLSFSVLLLAGGSLFLGQQPAEPFDAGKIFENLWSHAGLIVALLSVAVLGLTIRPVLRFFHLITFAEQWWFPWLDGHWEGEVNSNWPIVKTMMDSALRLRPSFNPLTDDVPADAPPARYKIEATIKSGLFHIEIHVTVPGTRRVSHTLFVRPKWARPEPPTLYYVYKQEDLDHPAATDARSHFGAATLALMPNGELRGEYWNARRGDRGLNAAGTLFLIRKHLTAGA